MIELMAPAGDLNRLKFAFNYGADAVYIGGKNYSLRANANNFSIDEIKEGCDFAHKRNKKVYVTVNIIFHEKDFTGIVEYLHDLEKCQVDGIIVSDPSIIDIVNKNNINLKLILSTQACIMDKYSALFYKNLGIKRVVLAREALKDDIKDVISTGIETEVFIHGAMCVSFSGKCVMSNYITNRDSNRGGCAQICRFLFDIDNCPNTFTMMPKDLNMVKNIKEMINMGISSLKIEGRMRSIYYISTVIYMYRNLIDKIVNNTITDEYTKYCINILNRVANRESAPQFFNELPDENAQYYLDRQEVSNQDFLGLIKGYDYENKLAILEERNYFKVGDTIQIFGPNTQKEIVINKMYNDNNEEIDVARHPGEIIKIPCDIEVFENDMVRVKAFDFL